MNTTTTKTSTYTALGSKLRTKIIEQHQKGGWEEVDKEDEAIKPCTKKDIILEAKKYYVIPLYEKNNINHSYRLCLYIYNASTKNREEIILYEGQVASVLQMKVTLTENETIEIWIQFNRKDSQPDKKRWNRPYDFGRLFSIPTIKGDIDYSVETFFVKV